MCTNMAHEPVHQRRNKSRSLSKTETEPTKNGKKKKKQSHQCPPLDEWWKQMNDNQDDQTNTSMLSRPKGLRAATMYIEVHMRTHIEHHNHEIVILSLENQDYEKCFWVSFTNTRRNEFFRKHENKSVTYNSNNIDKRQDERFDCHALPNTVVTPSWASAWSTIAMVSATYDKGLFWQWSWQRIKNEDRTRYPNTSNRWNQIASADKTITSLMGAACSIWKTSL